MEFSLEDFLPSYPLYEKNQTFPIVNVYEEDMYEVLQRKKEFRELTLDRIESSDVITDTRYLKHQLQIQRILSGNTPYTGLLVWHEVGTGKTISAISVAEAMKQFTTQRALVLVKGQQIADNFKQELLKINPMYNRDSNGELIYSNPSDLVDSAQKRKINSSIYQSYEISTFRVFARQIAQKMKRFPDLVREEYSNRVIIIDEVHNLREEDDKEKRKREEDEKSEKLYSIFHRFLHLVENCKIVLLSATPMKNDVSEFASIMNLLLPLSKQFDVSTFIQDYFINGTFRPEKKQDMMSRVKGYISYLRQSRADSKVVNEGELFTYPGQDTIEGFSLVPLYMKPSQSNLYYKAYLNDRRFDKVKKQLEQERSDVPLRRQIYVEQDGIWLETRQAILSCFPTYQGTSYGNKSNATVNRDKVTRPKQFYKDIAKLIIPDPTIPSDEKLALLEEYSIKYHYIIRVLIDPRSTQRKMFVYSNLIAGSGLFLLAELLQRFGFEETSLGSLSNKKKRFAIITSQNEADVQGLLQRFNSKENVRGEYIQMIIGSKTLGEGQTLKCIRDLFILTPHWNYTETEQAIGRGVRFRSHEELPIDERTVTIHRLLALPTQTTFSMPAVITRRVDKTIFLDKPLDILPQDSVMIQDSEGVSWSGTYYITSESQSIECTEMVTMMSSPITVIPDIQSVDYYMYQTSYEKDLLIKQVESVAQEIAIDCTMNKPRNQIDASYDDQRECFYKTCAYTCAVPLDPRAPDILDTYNLFYTEKEYVRIRDVLQFIFSTKTEFNYSFDQLVRLFSKQGISFPIHVILRCITDIIERKEPFRSPNGWISYLTEKYNVYYLTTHLFSVHEDHLYDAMHGPFYPMIDPQLYLNHLEASSIDTILGHLETAPLPLIQSILSTLDKTLLSLLCKGALEVLVRQVASTPEKNRLVVSIVEVGKRFNIIGTNNQLLPHTYYIETEDGWKWVIREHIEEDKRKDEEYRIVALQLMTDPTIIGYGIESDIFKCAWFEKNNPIVYLLDGKRKGTECTKTFNAEGFFRALTGNEPPIGNKRLQTCQLVHDVLSSRTPFERLLTKSLVFSESFHVGLKKWIDANIQDIFRAALQSNQWEETKDETKIKQWIQTNLEEAVRIANECQRADLAEQFMSQLTDKRKKQSKKDIQLALTKEQRESQFVSAQSGGSSVQEQGDVIMVKRRK